MAGALIITNFFVNDIPLFNKQYKQFNEYLRNHIFKSHILHLIKKKGKDFKIVPLDRISAELFEKNNIPISNLENYFTQEFERKIVTDSYSFYKTLPSILHLNFEYKKISLWDIEEVDSWGYFIYRPIKYIDYLKRIIDIEKPATVFYYDINYFNSKIAKQVFDSAGIKSFVWSSQITKTLHILEESAVPFIAGKITNRNLLELDRKAQPKPSCNPDVIFMLDSDDLSKYVIQLAKPLIEEKKQVLVIAVEDLSAIFSKENIQFRTFSSYLTEEILESNRKFSKDSLKHLHDLYANPPNLSNTNYVHCSIWNQLRRMFQFYYRKRFNQIALYIDVIGQILVNEKPHALVLFDDIGVFGKTIALTAKKNNIKTLTMQHGIFSNLPFIKTCSTIFAAYGGYTKDIMVRNGSSQSQVHCTGNIKLNKIKKVAGAKAEVYEEFKIPSNSKLVVVITEPGPMDKKMLNETIAAAKTMGKVQLIFKMHPGETDFERYHELAKDINYPLIVLKSYDLYKLLSAADAVILEESSTVGLEALFLKVPLIQFRKKVRLLDDWYPLGYFYIEEKVALEVNNSKDIIAAINAVTKKDYWVKHEKDVQLFFARHAGSRNSSVENSILKLIKQISD